MELNFESSGTIKARRKAATVTRQTDKQPSLFGDFHALTNEEFAKKYNSATKDERKEQIKTFLDWLNNGLTDFDNPDHLDILGIDY